ncbi:hypothetical protein UE46_00475 [Listeria weihenstephanensis]|uniref:Glucose-6-phosphate 1-dehydrogenase n=1 Tax=Listeria weihenstephanensis TaxID=1006155 RepID=A0A1S7FQI0_9LIST|nr:HI_0552 family protein [Listeria weihenstephanensis]AQY49686.1 hypothetical protein UE46_00475 [Listeria weihenstephanensis]
MQFSDADFALFDRDYFQFRQMKEFTPTLVESVKAEYKARWDVWKEFALLCQRETVGFGKPKVESWTNGWQVRSHFWAYYKGLSRQDSASMIAILLKKDSFRIYLEWHAYRSSDSVTSYEEHIRWVEFLPEWVRGLGIDVADYQVWTSYEDEPDNFVGLQDYLENLEVREGFRELLENSKKWLRIGRVIPKEEAVQCVAMEEIVRETMMELSYLYSKTEEL